MSELKNPRAARWDWDKILKPFGIYFPRKISFGDVDGEVEIKGQFLVTEGKRDFETVKGGQLYAMNARVKDGRTVFIVYGCPETGEIVRLQHWPNRAVSGDAKTLHQWVKKWSTWADKQPPATSRVSTFTP